MERNHEHRLLWQDAAPTLPPTTAPQRQTRECHSCGIQDIPPHRWPTMSTHTTCAHTNQTCKDCWQDWLEVQLGSSERIACISCRNTLTEQDVKAVASVPTYEKYLDLTAKGAVTAMPEFHWCLNPKCKSGQLHYGSHGFECGVCKYRHCTLCTRPWTIEHRRHCDACGAPQHEDKTCEQATIAHGADERATAEAMQELAKQCPGCERRVEKEDDGGCDWISCTKCGHEFCWLCLASHKDIKSKGNQAHKEDCEYYAVGGDLTGPFGAH